MADTDFPVVGIGASAGGIEALQALFEALPARPGSAFVVVQHRLPGDPSQLVQILSRWSRIPVRAAADGVRLERDCVFVAPAGVAVGLAGGVFESRSLEDARTHAGIESIDRFLESLAVEVGPRAVAVILSGTGSDGAAGALRVKQVGGLVLVQDPVSAMHAGMPTAALTVADHVLALPALADELVALASPSYVRAARSAVPPDDAVEAVTAISALVHQKVGIDLTAYKKTPILWRIMRRMAARRVPVFRDYEALLHDDPAELEELVRRMPIHVTEFFRDPEMWTVLERDVIPALVHAAAGAPIRAWTTACASGEEAYSLAILLAEKTSAFQVFATDASPEILGQASRGFFKAAALNSLSPERRQRFFYAADGTYRVHRSLREKMVFAPQDLLADPPLNGVDLVTCRNLLIYLEPDAAEQVVYLLHRALRMDGFLFLGRSESLPGRQTGFERVVPGAGIYRKVGPAERPAGELPTRPSGLLRTRSIATMVEAHAQRDAAVQGEQPAVLVDEQLAILRVYGDTGRF